jgi:hypothetical protein
VLHGAPPWLSSRRTRAQHVIGGLASVVLLAGMWAPVRASAEEPGESEAGLSIETGSPDALCPELESTRAAVRRRLGELVMPSGSGFVARYTIGHAPTGSPRDFVRLELSGADGIILLARDLPLEGESCSTMAEVIALVLDRYFRALLAGAPAAPGSEPRPPESSLPEARPLEVPAAAPDSSPAVSPQPLSMAPPRLAASSAPAAPARLDELALDLAFRRLERPALGVRATFELWPRVYVGTALHLSLIADRETLPDGGEVASRDVVWRAYAAWGPTFGALRTYLGPGVRTSVAHGAGRGLAREAAGYRASWALGVDVGAIWSMDDAWTFHVSGALDVGLSKLGGRFYVAGNEVLEPAPLQGWLGVGAGYDL